MKIQCAGAYTGSVDVDALEAEHSVAAVRERICALVGRVKRHCINVTVCTASPTYHMILMHELAGQQEPNSVKLIAGGRTLDVSM